MKNKSDSSFARHNFSFGLLRDGYYVSRAQISREHPLLRRQDKDLAGYLKDESVNLIYLGPPCNSDRNYNVLLNEESGAEADSQIHAFEDI